VDIVIVNWNGGPLVLEAARSAIAFGATAIVVDNGSVDGSVERVAAELPAVRCVRIGYNAGFAKGCNAGVAAGTGEFIFLLNPDARIAGGDRSEIARAFAHDPRVEVVGPRMIGGNGRWIVSVRTFPTSVVLVLYQLKLHRLARLIPAMRRYLMLDFQGDRPVFVDQPMGAAFIMRRRDWERHGGMDEGYFLWFEEVDLAKRVVEGGGRCLYWPHLVVRHVGGTSFARLSRSERQRIWNASAARYARRHLGPAAAALTMATFPINRAVAWAADLVDAVRRPVRPGGTTSQ
jgi:N-acetylglucosaminyl-diphospho-decaprenol L-rhamnosyltransferase